MKNKLVTHVDGKKRCFWVGADAAMRHYHDLEWGKPSRDSRLIFEKLCLEGFQAGLSWSIILHKRQNFRAAFDEFDCKVIANYDETKINALMRDPTIVRHRGKIMSVINNAQRALALIEEFGTLSAYFWLFEPVTWQPPEANAEVRTMSVEAKAMARDLKKRGWTFVGPTICYAFMQAMGLINDHVQGCDFSPPTTH